MEKQRLIKLFISVAIGAWLLLGWPPLWQNQGGPSFSRMALAANYLTNPSFTSGTTGWTLTTTVYDASYYQDSAGSVMTATAVGRNTMGTGAAEQTISTNINSSDIVELSIYWSKQCLDIVCVKNSTSVDIAKPSAPSTWITIWSDDTIPAVGSPTAWAGPSGLNVSSFFDETGEYKIRVYADLKNGNSKNAQSLAWLDNLNLDVTTASISVSISDGTVSYGNIEGGQSKSTIDLTDTQTAENDGNVTADFNIMTSNAANGTSWTIGSSSGDNIFVHEFSTNSGSEWTKFTAADSYQTLATGVEANGTVDFDLRITVPTGSDSTPKNITITVQAVE